MKLKPANLSSKLKPRKKVAAKRAAKKDGTPALKPANQRSIKEFIAEQLDGPIGDGAEVQRRM